MNTTEKGDALEIAVFNLLKAQIDADRFFAGKECCRIFRRKAYCSEKRKANIVFDISDLLGFFTPNIPGRRRVVEGTDIAV